MNVQSFLQPRFPHARIPLLHYLLGMTSSIFNLFMFLAATLLTGVPQDAWAQQPASSDSRQLAKLGSVTSVAMAAEQKTVKLYGAGGFAGLDAYQSGFFISAEGHILTVWSTVLDVENVIAVSSDGSRYEATVLGTDPNLEIAILSTNKPANNYFDLASAPQAQVGDRVLAFSNLFGIATGTELASLQQGIVMATTNLKARRGSLASVYQGPVYIIDAMTNNPGAAGGALTTTSGALLGLLGKELRDSRADIWLNYALPVSELTASIDRILKGESIARQRSNRAVADRPVDLANLGIVLIPDILTKTPCFVDLVQPNSRAAKAGLRPDDLILFMNSQRVTSQAALRSELAYLNRDEALLLLVQRENLLEEVLVSP